jgi:DNA recombination protein RmuC
MTENLNRLGKDIEKCVGTYNRTVGAMETRVMSTAKKLDNLEVSSKSLDPLQEIKFSNTFTKKFNNNYQDEE